MIESKTKSGFEFSIDPQAMNDMEIVDALVDLQSGNEVSVMNATSILITKLLGKEQKKKLYDHCRVDNRVPIDSITNEMLEIMASIREGKN